MAYDFSDRRSVVSGGGNFNILNLGKAGKQYKYFKCKDGGNRFDILPYTPSSDLHPLLATGKLKKGKPDYNLDIYVHKGVGAAEGSYICPKRNYGKPCPICEASDALKKQGDEDGSKALWPAREIFFNVVDYGDTEAGVQIFKTNNKYFQKPLLAAQADAEKDPDMQESGPVGFFANPENGLTVKVVGAPDKFNGNEFTQISSVVLTKRKNSVKEYLDEVCEFDKYLKLLSYDELEAIFTGASVETEEEEDEPAPAKKKPAVDDEDDVPPPPKKPAKKVEEEEEAPKPPANKCPYGHKWGKENDATDDCDACFAKDSKLWKNCAKGE